MSPSDDLLSAAEVAVGLFGAPVFALLVGAGRADVAGVERGADAGVDLGVAELGMWVPVLPPRGRFPGGGTDFGAGYVVGAGWSTVTLNVVRAVVVDAP